MLLLTTIITPFLGAGLCTLINSSQLGLREKNSYLWRTSLGSSVLTFALSMVLWNTFNGNTTLYQYTTSGTTIEFGSILLGLDGISLYFFLLTTFITPVCLLCGRYSIRRNANDYILMFLVLEGMLGLVFTVQDLLLFYVFFESVLIPLFLMVGTYGSSHMRIRASYLLFLYTLFGSLFMLLSFMMISFYTGTTSMPALTMYNMDISVQLSVFTGIMLSMAIKTPLMPFNTWLTYAHSEAPVGGSVILASVILKLATYGYLRIMLQLLPDACNYYSPVVQLFAAISVVYGSLITIRQTDFKKLVAYSSVAHMGVVVLGLFSNTVEGIEGAVMLGIAHGLVSSGMFYLVGGMLYDRFHTRTIKYYRGLAIYMPMFSIMFFLFSLSNAAVPLTLNWVAETMVLTGVFQRNAFSAVLGSTGIVLSVVYSIWLYARMCHGTFSPYLRFVVDMTRREYAVLLPLLTLTLVFGIIPNVILSDIHIGISSVIYY